MIETQALIRSIRDLPEVFLHGMGLTDAFITYLRRLAQDPPQYYICFISYSSKDQVFAKQLHADLERSGIRCFFADHNLQIGEAFKKEIEKSIQLSDKLLVILSQHSLLSEWVEFEVNEAIKKEHQQQKLVLFPIKLDETVTQTSKAWADDIRSKLHIGDFTRWQDHDAYQLAFKRLLHDLHTTT